MKPEEKSLRLLSITRAKAKMLEYSVPPEYQEIDIRTNPNKLFALTIGSLGDYAYKLNQSDSNKADLDDLKKDLRFSSRFFDSYLQSEMEIELNDYLLLIGAASYYLCDLPGSSMVLADRINGDCPDLETDGLSSILLVLLCYPRLTRNIYETRFFGGIISSIRIQFIDFWEKGEGKELLLSVANELREIAYRLGTPRQLLFADVISAVIKRKIENSSWETLPVYSGLLNEVWKDIIRKKDFVKELWPAQHLIGQYNVLKGESAVIQMPTSAGKTKASEMIIRSAFLSARTMLAIIIAPFRALCHEITNDLQLAFHNEPVRINELNDVFEIDVATATLMDQMQILVVTPEKLLYVLNYHKEIASMAGLFIFDEGHQFDNGARGITYELLLTTILLYISAGAQKILISAVIQNAQEIGSWLDEKANIISGNDLMPTFRTVGFASFMTNYGPTNRGLIKYVDEKQMDDFFVPRVIEQVKLNGNNYGFPQIGNGNSTALYLGLKLVQNGGVAIFCGKKDSVTTISKMVLEISNYGFSFDIPNLIPDIDEVNRLWHLHVENLGEDCPSSQSAQKGIFSHHNNIPHGIRISIEYAMHKKLISFIICTSTLAQGVNLPIRYLIVSSFNQGAEPIKVRDFHNLIGRAGRAGIHTEGSIIFADPKIYDGKSIRWHNWHWNQAQNLLTPEKGEPCSSKLSDILDSEANEEEKKSFIAAIENFMLSNWDEIEKMRSNNEYSDIVTKTLGYALADEKIKKQLINLFNAIERSIRENISDPDRRSTYGRTLYGINECQSLEEWYNENINRVKEAKTFEELLNIIWDYMQLDVCSESRLKITNIEAFKAIIFLWINGNSYYDWLNLFITNKIMLIWGKQRRRITINKVVDIFNNKIFFEGCKLINAIYEFASQNETENRGLMRLLLLLQKQLKYGLPNEASIVIYELGFCDRVIAQDLQNSLNLSSSNRLEIIQGIRIQENTARQVISKYPAYFQMKFDNLIG